MAEYLNPIFPTSASPTEDCLGVCLLHNTYFGALSPARRGSLLRLETTVSSLLS